MRFSGFPDGTRYTPVPNPLFGPLLEAIQDPAELKCTLRAIWLLHKKKGYPRYVGLRELLLDRVLLSGLKGLDVPPREAIRRGMALGVRRGTFLFLRARNGTEDGEVYLLNDGPGRRAIATMGRGEFVVDEGASAHIADDEPAGRVENIFALYEDNIGVLTPILAEEMKEAESSYPWPWIQDAFKIAVSRNARNWRYIEATLRRWATQGKDDGEPGGHSKKNTSAEEFEAYLRQRGRLPRS